MTTSSSAARSSERSIVSCQIGCGSRSQEVTPNFGRTEVKPSSLARRRSSCSCSAPSSAVRSRSRQRVGVDPGAEVGRRQPVLLDQPVPVVDPGRVGRRVVREVALAEDLDAGGAEVGDLGEHVLERHHGVDVAGVAVGGDAVLEGALGRRRHDDALGRGAEVRAGDQRRDVGAAQEDRRPRGSARPVERPPRLRHGDGGGLVELPADVGRRAQLVEGHRAALQGPQRHVVGDPLAVDHDLDAVEQARRAAAVVGLAQPELEAGDPAVLDDVAEAPALDGGELEHRLLPFGGRGQHGVRRAANLAAMSRAPPMASATEVSVGLQAMGVGMTPLPAT